MKMTMDTMSIKLLKNWRILESALGSFKRLSKKILNSIALRKLYNELRERQKQSLSRREEAKKLWDMAFQRVTVSFKDFYNHKPHEIIEARLSLKKLY